MSDVSRVARDLVQTVETAASTLRRMTESDATMRPRAGGWSRKEILGHLIDSAANNHHRFVRAQQTSHLAFPPYDQNHWVAVQRYDRRGWRDLVELWIAYNLHLAHVIEGIPVDRLGVTCEIGPDEPGRLDHLVVDYLRHLRHHLRQLEPALIPPEDAA